MLSSIKGTIIVSYIFLVASFTTVAIYDVAKIISDYVYDNRLTIVKRKNTIENGLPFLEDLMVCLRYDSNVLFPMDKSDIFPAMVAAWDMDDAANTSTKTASHMHNMLRLLTADSIREMDSGGLTQLAQRLETTAGNLSFLLDSIIAHPSSVQRILEAWADVEHGFASPSENQAIRKTALVSVSLDDVCFIVPASKISQLVFTEFIRLDGWASKQLNTTALSMKVSSSGSDSEFFYSGSAGHELPIDVDLRISNVGCFDTALFPPCQYTFRTEDQCLTQESHRITEEVCKCKKFSDVVRRVLKDHKSDNNSDPYCTSSHYSTCFERAEQKIERWWPQAAEEGICRPCFTCKNSYQASVTSSCQGCSSLLLLTVTDDQLYLVYEDRPQFTLPQLISQIGGELGLYIGFSMLSLLQFVVFVYQMQEHRKGSTDTVSPSMRISSKLSSWFRFFVQYSTRNIHDFDGKRVRKQNEDVEKVKRDQAKNELDIRALEAKICRLEAHIDERFDALLAASKAKRIVSGWRLAKQRK